MALINSKGNYIRLLGDGRFEIYPTEEARQRIKNSVPAEQVMTKYRELLADLETQAERRYYDAEDFAKEYDALDAEYHRYEYNLINFITGQEYPIMAKVYPTVNFSIPELIEGGGVLCSENETVEDSYMTAKQTKRWGETTDA